MNTEIQKQPTPNQPHQKQKPDWAGENLLSRVVNVLIETQPIYRLMKQQARQVLIKTAEKNGIPWRENYDRLKASGVQKTLETLTNSAVIYPDYYQVPFHAYDKGNLCWDAAFEAESATYAMALRVWKDEPLTPIEAQDRLRSSFHQVLASRDVQATDILDIGCSVGISTLTLHRYYQHRNSQSQAPAKTPAKMPVKTPVKTIGLDLSPYMLAIAQQQDADREISAWVHGQAESTGFADESFDLVTLQFVLHELPRSATTAIFQEIHRILRPGGTCAIVDNNPHSKVIQNLPPVLFTLMKSTEPWTDDYYTFNVEEALATIGFVQIATVDSDPRHRTIVANKPGL
jgi:ubiquinone/menaquinone biosynthesis C-methylase UbiE